MAVIFLNIYKITLLCMLLLSINTVYSQTNNMIPTGSKMEEKIEKFETIFRDKFLEILEKNGYHNGYNFELASIGVNLHNDYYNAAKITGTLSYNGPVIYIPKGLSFESLSEITQVFMPSGISFEERDRGSALHYWADDYPDLAFQKGISLIKKGPYPGIEYFTAEVAAIEASLKKHKPIIEIHSFTVQSFNLGDEKKGVMQRAPNFYQVSDDVVYMEFLYDPDSQIDFGFKIHYNIKTGEIINKIAMSPPMLM